MINRFGSVRIDYKYIFIYMVDKFSLSNSISKQMNLQLKWILQQHIKLHTNYANHSYNLNGSNTSFLITFSHCILCFTNCLLSIRLYMYGIDLYYSSMNMCDLAVGVCCFCCCCRRRRWFFLLVWYFGRIFLLIGDSLVLLCFGFFRVSPCCSYLLCCRLEELFDWQ